MAANSRDKFELAGRRTPPFRQWRATLLTADEVLLTNIPFVADIRTMRRLLGELGVQAEFQDDHSVRSRAEKIILNEAPYDLVKTMRASVLALGEHRKNKRCDVPIVPATPHKEPRCFWGEPVERVILRGNEPVEA